MTDLEAIAAYRAKKDPEAFKHLVETYQGMVFSACDRVLSNATDAEDAAQETFLKLTNHVNDINVNPASWLYTCALNTARNRVKSESARRNRERSWSEENRKTVESADDFHEILPILDTCITELPDGDRELLLQYYFKKKTQSQLGTEQGVSQQAIKKRLDKTVEELRRKLKSKGIAVPVVLLVVFLGSGNLHAAVPTALTASLVKIGLAGLGKGAVAGSGASTSVWATLEVKIIAAILVGALVVTGFLFLNYPKKEPVQMTKKKVPIQQPPKVVKETIVEKKESKRAKEAMIEGVPNIMSKVWQRGEPGRECYLFWALDSTLQGAGVTTNYEDIMGLSGCGFRLQVSKPLICASCPDVSSSTFLPIALKVYGYRELTENYGPSKKAWDDVEATQKGIRKSIDAGVPVMSMAPFPFYATIVGYTDKAFIAQQHYPQPDTRHEIKVDNGHLVIVGKEREVGKIDREKIINSFKTILEQGKKANWYEPENEDPERLSGLAAYDAWIKQLNTPLGKLLKEHIEKEYAKDGKELPEEGKMFSKDGPGWTSNTYMSQWHANSWPYMNFVDARTAAAIYLQDAVPLFKGEERKKVEKLASIYEKLEEHLRENWNLFPQRHWVRKQKNFIWSPAGKIPGILWTEEMRKKGAEALKKAKKMEEEAYTIMEEFF